MRTWPLLLLCAATLPAAVIRGTVIENQTGRSLSRALVKIEPVPGTPGAARSMRTDRYGNFEFSQLAEGQYLITASRRFFLPAEYGQKRWNSAGTPFALTEADRPFLTLRLQRYSAINGTVVDENDVGLPYMEVSAYRNTKPPQLVANGAADERGVYRVYGLEPGQYLVRSSGSKSEEGSFLPTFSKEAQMPDQAFPTLVAVGEEAKEANIRPVQGALYTLTVSIEFPLDPPPPATVTVVSEMWRKSVHFDGVSPMIVTIPGVPKGEYEVFAESENPMWGVYLRTTLYKDSTVGASMAKIQDSSVYVQGAPSNAIEVGDIQVMLRRKDLAGSPPPVLMKVGGGRTYLHPGPWQVAIAPGSGYYLQSFFGPGSRFNQKYEGWIDMNVPGGRTSLRFTFSSGGAGVRGLVKSAGAPVVGAPVFLEPISLTPDRRVVDPYVVRTDAQGYYHFTGLPPAAYRILSTFEYRNPDDAIMTEAGATEITLAANSEAARDLELYVIR